MGLNKSKKKRREDANHLDARQEMMVAGRRSLSMHIRFSLEGGCETLYSKKAAKY
jgi:hypothetical protein